jgi:hypothetical protein
MPQLNFLAQREPDENACRRLEELYPTNPFATFAFAESARRLGAEPWLVGVCSDGALESGCIASLRKGRLDRSLVIDSVPPLTDEQAEVFWSSLQAHSGRAGITRLEINSFGSSCASIPSLGKELFRRRRWEYTVPLRGADLMAQMTKTHRQPVRKGMKAGLSVLKLNDPTHLESHRRLMTASMSRRHARGEEVPEVSRTDFLRPYMETGLCTLFQAIRGGQPVSSMLVAQAVRGAYLQSSGTSPAGMDTGASHFLLYEIMSRLQLDGVDVFNLGGVDNIDSGLALFKSHFGASATSLEAAGFYVGGAMHEFVSSLARSFRERLGAKHAAG